jgi:hypothetical protein
MLSVAGQINRPLQNNTMDNQSSNLFISTNEDIILDDLSNIRGSFGTLQPRVCSLPNGALLVGYISEGRQSCGLYVKLSYDDGKHFREPILVAQGLCICPKFSILALPAQDNNIEHSSTTNCTVNGDSSSSSSSPTVLIAYITVLPQGPDRIHGINMLNVVQSDDYGRTWATHTEVERTFTPTVLFPPVLFAPRDGNEVHLCYSQATGDLPQFLLVKRSIDRGRNWGPSNPFLSVFNVPPMSPTNPGRPMGFRNDDVVGLAEAVDAGTRQRAVVMLVHIRRQNSVHDYVREI